MDNTRMSNADMIQYCNEALAWEDFGFVDRYFFESVKKILLGECSASEDSDEENNNFSDIKRPVTSEELEPEYKNFPDEYYIDKENKSPEKKEISEEDAFSDSMFNKGFFVIAPEGQKYKTAKPSEKSEKKKDNTGFTVKI
ncbi:MAG: hypothetical protein K2K66_02585 [Ruminococcus sp.]|nr:hypothetical protein [Ruminococcus sp.]MDE6539053.1 hypothetical protein [Ruminococcus sp.]